MQPMGTYCFSGLVLPPARQSRGTSTLGCSAVCIGSAIARTFLDLLRVHWGSVTDQECNYYKLEIRKFQRIFPGGYCNHDYGLR